MKINNEEVERVETFESLRAGDVAWVVECSWCDAKHRLMLIRYDPRAVLRAPAGTRRQEPAWLGLPLIPCAGFGTMSSVSRGTVETGRVYRVVDTAQAPAESTHEKRPEVVR